MFEQLAIVGHQVIDLRALARGEHQVILEIAMERQVFVGEPKVRRICAHGRGVFGHVPNKRQRRITNCTGRRLVERPPPLARMPRLSSCWTTYSTSLAIWTGKNSNAPASAACPIKARATSDSTWSAQNESTHTLASTMILRGAPLTGSSLFDDSVLPWPPHRPYPNRGPRAQATQRYPSPHRAGPRPPTTRQTGTRAR